MNKGKLPKASFYTIAYTSLLVILFSCKAPIYSSSSAETSPSVQDSLISNYQYTLLQSIEIKAKFLATNSLFQSFVVTEDNDVVMYSPEGEELYRYSNFDLGDISRIDASNPFNILIFYEDFQTVEILDRRLDKTSTFDLFQSSSPNIKAVGISSDQNVWIYDELNFRLKKLDATGRIIFQSPDLSNTLPEGYTPNFIIEAGGHVFLSEANGSVIQFDLFGNYMNSEKFNIPSGKLQVKQLGFVYIKGNSFLIKNQKSGNLDMKTIPLPKNTSVLIDAEMQKDRMMILDEERLSIYTFAKK